MNTIDATPQLSFGDRATLVLQRYPLVNALDPYKYETAKKTFANVIYGKQILTDAGPLDPGA